MKISINFSIPRLYLVLALLPLATISCKKDEIRSKEMLVYLQPGQEGIPTQTQTIALTHTPADIRGDRNTEVFIYSSRELTDAAAEMTIAPDPEQLNDYNLRFNQNYALLPPNSYQITSGNTYTINVGERRSNAIQIQITQPEILTNPEGYLLPLSIDQVQSRDKGIMVSNSHGTVFIRVTYGFTNIESTQDLPLGPLVDRSGWSVSVSNTTNNAPGSNLVDGSNSTVWRSSNSSSAAKWIEVDMGVSNTLRGFQLSPNYTNTNENGTSMTITTSIDNVAWTEQGVWMGTGPTSGTNASNPDFKGIQFIAPVTARYFRITYNSWVSGNRVGMAELNAIE